MQMTRDERIARLETYIAEGRIIRGKWHSTDAHGRATACLLGALGRDIDDTSKCPAGIMWPWLAELTPSFDDNGSLKEWPAMVKRYGAIMRGIGPILGDAAAERRCLAATMIACMDIAEPHDTAGVVAPVRALWVRAARGDEPTREEWAAAAAWAAAWAAEAAAAAWAAAAAEAAARAAARSALAALAARAAARSAARSALAAWEAEAAARAAAWDRITDACLTAIEAEIKAKEAK